MFFKSISLRGRARAGFSHSPDLPVRLCTALSESANNRTPSLGQGEMGVIAVAFVRYGFADHPDNYSGKWFCCLPGSLGRVWL